VAFTLPGFTVTSLDSYFKVGTVGNTATTVNLNSATARVGAVFMARVSENMTGVLVAHNANTGAPTGTQVDLYAVDANGLPTGSSLATATYTPTGSANNTVTFASAYGVTAGVCYALVWRNTTATPGSNIPTFQVTSTDVMVGNLRLTSSDSGSTWGASFTGLVVICAPIYATFGVDSYLPVNNASTTSGVPLYNTSGSRVAREAIKVNFEMDVLLWRSVFRFNSNVGSPSHSLISEVCSSSAVLSTSTRSVPCAGIGSTTYQGWTWDIPYRLLANTDYYITIAPSGATAGDSSNYSRTQVARPLVKPATIGPLLDGFQSTASAAPSFSQTATYAPQCELFFEIPKPNQMYYAGMRGGFNG